MSAQIHISYLLVWIFFSVHVILNHLLLQNYFIISPAGIAQILNEITNETVLPTAFTDNDYFCLWANG